jgi:hypothetical protein
LRHLGDEAQLGLLLGGRQWVSGLSGGEAALRTDSQHALYCALLPVLSRGRRDGTDGFHRPSVPELPRRQLGTFCQSLKLSPDDLRMVEPPPQPTGGPGDDAFATDQTGIPDQALCHELRMFDEIGGVADNPGDEDLPFRQFGVPGAIAGQFTLS